MSVSAARKAAYRILLGIEQNEGHSDDLLRSASVDALAPVDRNLATALVMGVLRWQLRLDEVIRPLLKRPNAKLDPEIRIALRLGSYQLLYMDRVPAHAAINESVELSKQAGHRFAAGMVNAVLRSIASNGVGEAGEVAGKCENDAVAAYPSWMVERWSRHFGAESTCEICAYGQSPARLSVRLIDPRAEAELEAAGILLDPGLLLSASRSVVDGDVTATEVFRAGRVRIQDEGSQLIAEIAAACGFTTAAARVLDCCAAPGGKTMILADRLPNAHIVACESSPLRHSSLCARLAIYGHRVECWLADAAALAEEAAFDLVLADVPCSGTGTLGRNPEIRHRLVQSDLTRHAERQKAILRSALRAVKPEGCVVYSTCSLEPEENENVIAEMAATIAPVKESLDALRAGGILTDRGATELQNCITPEGALRLVPGALGTDGFFVAILKES